jgi:hypothetical protein
MESGGAFSLKNMELKICLKNDMEHQLTLFNRVFHKDMTAEEWKRKHYKNPYCKTSESVCMYKGDKLIGFNMFLPQKYIVEGTEMIFLQSCESAVDVKERGCGYLRDILKYAEEQLSEKYDIIYGLPNEKSQRTFEKLNYKKKMVLSEFFSVGKIKNIFTDLTYGKDVSEVSFIHDVDLYFSNHKKIICTKKYFDDKVIIKDNRSVRIKNDKVFYEWKIDQNHGDYRYFYICQGNEIKAYCIARLSMKGRVRRINLIETYAADGCDKQLRHILKELKKVCSVITIMANAEGTQGKFLKKIGFMRRKNRTIFLMYKVISGDEQLEKIMEDNDNWQFSFIECDTIFN